MTNTTLLNDPVLIYLDETGDHSLDKIDKDFPIFVLTAFLVRKSNYINNIVPQVYQLKLDYFGHEGIILHSRDIRKANPPFEILFNKDIREQFLSSISSLMSNCNFHLAVSVIQKEKLKNQYIKPFNPYELSLKFIMERICVLLKSVKQNKVRFIAESRGQKEDNELKLCFYEIIRKGTEKINKNDFSSIEFILSFIPKSLNIIGTQIADLCGYPIGRQILNPGKANKAFDCIQPKILQNINGWDYFKVFP